MQFKIDRNLLTIARMNPNFPEIEPASEIAENMFRYFVGAGLIKNESENHGKAVGALTAKRNVFEVCQTLAFYLGKSVIPSEIFDAFCNLIIE